MTRPPRLYKYQSVNARTLENLKLRRIWFSHPSSFNDPFDCAMQVAMKRPSDEDLVRVRDYYLSRSDLPAGIRLKFEQASPDQPEFRMYIESAISDFADVAMATRNLGVACFSAKNDDLLMWSHYADGHRGFCLEFDTSGEPFSKCEPVLYCDDPPSVNPVDVLDNVSTGTNIIDALMRTKHAAWSYEEEWRALHAEPGTEFTYPFRLLTGVYFGAAMPTGQRDVIAQLLLGSPTQLYEMVRGKTVFSVVALPMRYEPAKFE